MRKMRINKLSESLVYIIVLLYKLSIKTLNKQNPYFIAYLRLRK